jgi:uncharacterized protein YifE (UPF0438 family)
MRIIYLFSIFSFILLTPYWAQTKIIAHKSHSGSTHQFSKLLASNKLHSNSNFGIACFDHLVIYLDSVVAVNDSTTLLYKKEVIQNTCNVQLQSMNSPKKSNTKIDTLINHPLFRNRGNLDAIKANLKQSYVYANDMNKVFFRGFDNHSQFTTKAGASTTQYIRVLPDQLNSGIVKGKMNGKFISNGACSPQIVFGLEKQNNGVWETWIDLSHIVQMDCGLPFVNSENSDFTLNLDDLITRYSYSTKKLTTGFYRITVKAYEGAIIESNTFTIKLDN